MTIKLLHVIGARPQFIKYFPVQQAMDKVNKRNEKLTSVLVHTGQHYDYQMSQVFFDELGIRPPGYHLEAGSGNHGWQTAMILQRLEEVLLKEKPEIVVVYGDTNSTMGAALAATKLNIPLAHVEAGLRSFNKRMPEEINRVLTDHVSTYLFCPSKTAIENLRREGFHITYNEITQSPDTSVHLHTDIDHPYIVQTGDVMYDLILHASDVAEEKSHILEKLNIESKQYVLLTIHRAENTDNPEQLKTIIAFVNEMSKKKPVILPMHPRMVKIYANIDSRFSKDVRIIEPLGYFDLLTMLKNAQCLMTDSGGMQKEAYWLHIPCITLRSETEWVETVQSGWNILWQDYRNTHSPQGETNAYGDGYAAEKIIDILVERTKD